ncbi:hypothetical protein BJ508DRAFT_336017 [Ascobolus immersus RN42]|uniref:Uncharacterized protein n=1 Tax=Ascobolus immersus RN42 TaxID=1160509 RepID=A0A3N4HHD2_ASCIM|nr:hypothetical protein BJ508DRAFT_336017 [Ascobolus immersus RN42]
MSTTATPTYLYFVIATTREKKDKRNDTREKTLGVFESLEKANNLAITFAQKKYEKLYSGDWSFMDKAVNNKWETGIFYDELGCFKMKSAPGNYNSKTSEWSLKVSVHAHKVKLNKPIRTSKKAVASNHNADIETAVGAVAQASVAPSKRPAPEETKPEMTGEIAYVSKVVLYELSVHQEWFDPDNEDYDPEPIHTYSDTTYFASEKAARVAFKETLGNLVEDYPIEEADLWVFDGRLPEWDDVGDLELGSPASATEMKVTKKAIDVVFRNTPIKGKPEGNVETLNCSTIQVADWDGTVKDYHRIVTMANALKKGNGPVQKRQKVSASKVTAR